MRLAERLPAIRLREQWPELLAKVKALGAEKHGLVTDDEFVLIAGRLLDTQ